MPDETVALASPGTSRSALARAFVRGEGSGPLTSSMEFHSEHALQRPCQRGALEPHRRQA
jgi:hypothetical protein